MPNIIKIKRGVSSNLPTLNYGEQAVCYDTRRLFIGISSTNNDNSRSNEEVVTATRIHSQYAMAQINANKNAGNFSSTYPNKVTIFNSAGNLTCSGITTTELDKLDNITENVQTALNRKIEGGKGIRIVIQGSNPGAAAGFRTIWFKK